MALLFAENGLSVSLSDPAEKAMDGIVEKAEKAGYHNRVTKCKGTYGNVCHTLRRFR